MQLLNDEQHLLEKLRTQKKPGKKCIIKGKLHDNKEDREVLAILQHKDWKCFESSKERFTQVADAIINSIESLKFFLKNYELISEKPPSDRLLAKYLSDNCDKIYDDNDRYYKTLLSPRRKSFYEQTQIFYKYITSRDKIKIAQSYGYKDHKSVARLAARFSDGDELNYKYIREQQRAERNRILVPETSDYKISELSKLYKLHQWFARNSKGSKRQKVQAILRQISPDTAYSVT